MNKAKTTNLSFLPLLGFTFVMSYLISCSGESKKNNSFKNNGVEKKDTVLRKPPSSFSDTLAINFPSVVFYNPDSLQLKKIKEITTQNEYETEVHNCFYLMRNARTVLKKYWPEIHIIETSINRYLLFVKVNKSKTCIDLNSYGDMCGIFLFDGKKEPELVDMMNIDTALGFYFGK